MEYCDKCIWFSYILGGLPSCDRVFLNERFPQACSCFVQKTPFDENPEVQDWLRHAFKAHIRIIGKAPNKKEVVRMLTDIRKQVRKGVPYMHLLNLEDVAIIFGNLRSDASYYLSEMECNVVNWVLDHYHYDTIWLVTQEDKLLEEIKDELCMSYENLPDGYFFLKEPEEPSEKWKMYSLDCGLIFLWNRYSEDDYSGYEIQYKIMEQLYEKVISGDYQKEF